MNLWRWMGRWVCFFLMVYVLYFRCLYQTGFYCFALVILVYRSFNDISILLIEYKSMSPNLLPTNDLCMQHRKPSILILYKSSPTLRHSIQFLLGC